MSGDGLGPLEPDSKVLVEIARMRMPFGRYAGTRLIDLPEPYVVWFRKQGFPRGRLGVLFGTLYEIKANGLEGMLGPLREPDDPRYRSVSSVRASSVEGGAEQDPPARDRTPSSRGRRG